MQQNLNNGSMTNIIFYDKHKKFDNLIKELSYLNIVICGDGFYHCLKNEFGYVFDKFDEINYTNTKLEKLNCDLIFESYLDPIHMEYLNKIINIFKYVCKSDTKYELSVDVYYDKLTKDYEIVIPNQKITGTSVNYKYDEKYEMDNRYIKYLQVHSHNSMMASFSGIDDKDEVNKLFCYYGVIGKIQKESTLFDVDTSFRIWTGIRFAKIGLNEIFDTKLTTSEIDQKTKTKLDEIIKESKIETRFLKTEFSVDDYAIFGDFT